MMLLPEISRLAEVTAVVDQSDVSGEVPCAVIGIEEFRSNRSAFDVVVCQIGNNIHHEFVWKEARLHPSVVVLHELVLHHLVTEATLARGDAEGYVSLLRESDGAGGEAFARGRAAGHHFEIGNFLFPASSALAAASRALIVHNRWSRDRLREVGVTTPIAVIDHPFDRLNEGADPDGRELRRDHGFPEDSTIIGMFGFVTMPKRPSVVFEAFSRALRINPALRLLIVGEPAPNVDLEALADGLNLPPDVWSSTGWTTDEQFDQALLSVDRVVALRYPSAGESSGAIARVFAAGKPLAVSDYAQFSELPDDVAFKIPMGELEVERLEQFMAGRLETSEIARRQKSWIASHGDPATVASQYLDVLEKSLSVPPSRERSTVGRSSLGLMPSLLVESFRAELRGGSTTIELSIRNEGNTTIRSLNWGEPSYRLIVKVLKEGEEVESNWWTLPGDLRQGDVATLRGTLRGSGDEVALVHGWVGVPLADDEPFFRAEVSS